MQNIDGYHLGGVRDRCSDWTSDGKRYKLAYVIVTNNRPDAVSNFIKLCFSELKKRNIGVYFVDGSDSDETQIIIDNSKEKESGFLHYYHIPRTTPTERTFFVLPEVNSEYICLGGDTRKPILKELDKIISLMDKSYLVIQTSGLAYNLRQCDGNITEYDSPAKMYYEHCDDGITLSTVFFKSFDYSSLLKDIDNRKMKNIWSPLLLYYKYCNNGKFAGCYYNTQVMLDAIPGKGGSSFWLKNSAVFFEVWGKMFEEFVTWLPEDFGTESQKWQPASSILCNTFRIDKLLGILLLKWKRLLPDKLENEHKRWLKKLGASSRKHIDIAEKMNRTCLAFILLFYKPVEVLHGLYNDLPESIQDKYRRLKNRVKRRRK